MKDETYPYRYDNCKDCVARCPHAGKDRKFVYHGFKSCKVVKEPPRLDRSAWEPCENCGLKCKVCFRNGTDRCKKCKNHDLYIPVSHFCQCCGRPLTDAAWKMLEKRLEGAK